MRVALISVAALGMLAAAGEAKAEPASRQLSQEAFVLPDQELARIRGAAPLINPSTAEAVRMVIDLQTRMEFRGTAEIANLVFDNWFNDVGAQLIANNLSLP